MGVFIHPHFGGKHARFALKSVHIIWNCGKKKKGVTGHNKAKVGKQSCYAELGDFWESGNAIWTYRCVSRFTVCLWESACAHAHILNRNQTRPRCESV